MVRGSQGSSASLNTRDSAAAAPARKKPAAARITAKLGAAAKPAASAKSDAAIIASHRRKMARLVESGAVNTEARGRLQRMADASIAMLKETLDKKNAARAVPRRAKSSGKT